MIFELHSYTINLANGDVVKGESGHTIGCYTFSDPAIETTNEHLRKFLLDHELVGKDKFKTILFYCTKNKKIYCNLINFYRKETNTQLDSEVNFSCILAEVTVKVVNESDPVPEHSFAKYTKTAEGKSIYLTCAMALKSDSVTSPIQHSSRGDAFRKVALGCRAIHSRNHSAVIIDETYLRRYFVESSSAKIPGASTNRLDLVVFYITVHGSSVFFDMKTSIVQNVGDIKAIRDEHSRISLGGLCVLNSNQYGIQFVGKDVYSSMRSILTAPSGESFTSGCISQSSGSARYIPHINSTPAFKEFVSFQEFHTYLLGKYGASKAILLFRTLASEFYSDKACKDSDLIGVSRSCSASCYYADSNIRMFDKTSNPTEIFQNKVIYINISIDVLHKEIYIINTPSKFVKIIPTLEMSAVSYMDSILLNTNLPENSYSGTKYAYNAGSDLYIPNSHFNDILPYFSDCAVYNDNPNWASAASKRICVYNGKVTQYVDTAKHANQLCSGLSIDKTNLQFRSADPVVDQMHMTLNADNVYSDLQAPYIDSADLYTGSALPLPPNIPLTQIDQVDFSMPYSFIKVTT